MAVQRAQPDEPPLAPQAHWPKSLEPMVTEARPSQAAEQPDAQSPPALQEQASRLQAAPLDEEQQAAQPRSAARELSLPGEPPRASVVLQLELAEASQPGAPEAPQPLPFAG